MKTGYIRLEIPAVLQNMAGIRVTTSLDSGGSNTNILIPVGKVNIEISGNVKLQDEFFTINMKVPVIITDRQITRLSLPFLSILEGLAC